MMPPATLSRELSREDTANNEIKNYESILQLLLDMIESCDFRLGNICVRCDWEY